MKESGLKFLEGVLRRASSGQGKELSKEQASAEVFQILVVSLAKIADDKEDFKKLLSTKGILNKKTLNSLVKDYYTLKNTNETSLWVIKKETK